MATTFVFPAGSTPEVVGGELVLLHPDTNRVVRLAGPSGEVARFVAAGQPVPDHLLPVAWRLVDEGILVDPSGAVRLGRRRALQFGLAAIGVSLISLPRAAAAASLVTANPPPDFGEVEIGNELYNFWVFTNPATTYTFEPVTGDSRPVDILLVGGGGSGGGGVKKAGGGGGAGGLKVIRCQLTPGTSYSVVVGAKGAQAATGASGNKGGDSSVSYGGSPIPGEGSATATVSGGGFGGGYLGGTASNGGTGGSGGGGSFGGGLGSGTTGEGNNGGLGAAGTGNIAAGGGGGGKETPGLDGNANAGGSGGVGYSVPAEWRYDGVARVYAAGGGGGGGSADGAGGGSAIGVAAATYIGSGGGGGGSVNQGSTFGGAGADGIVIIRAAARP
jgi:hypothetical protein